MHKYLLGLLALLLSIGLYAQTKVTVDNIIENPFGKEITLDNVKNVTGLRLKSVQLPMQNLHDTSVTDTVVQLKKKRNEIWFYKAKHATFLYSLSIYSKKVKLIGGIHTGMSREAFFNTVKDIRDNGGSQQQFNDEFQNSVIVYFKRNKLKRIEVGYYLD